MPHGGLRVTAARWHASCYVTEGGAAAKTAAEALRPLNQYLKGAVNARDG